MRLRRFLCSFALALMLTGCMQEMANQSRVETYEASTFFDDGQSMRPPVPGTIARGQLPANSPLLMGVQDGRPVETFPIEINAAMLERGQQRYRIYCAPCHGYAGDGDGMVVRRGFPAPPTYHSERLRIAAPGHLFDVITRGINRMPRFSDRIVPEDRWAIAAYIRALQLSQNLDLNTLSAAQRAEIQKQIP